MCSLHPSSQVRQVVQSHPHLRRISFIGHSLGGVVSRFAIGQLYRPPGLLHAGSAAAGSISTGSVFGLDGAVTSQGLGTLTHPAAPGIDRSSGWEQGRDVSSSGYSSSGNTGDSLSSASLECAVAGGYSASVHASDRASDHASDRASVAQVVPVGGSSGNDLPPETQHALQGGCTSAAAQSGNDSSKKLRWGMSPSQLPHQQRSSGVCLSSSHRDAASHVSYGGKGEGEGGGWSV